MSSTHGVKPAECAGCGRVLDQGATVVRDHEARLWHHTCYARRVKAGDSGRRRKKGR